MSHQDDLQAAERERANRRRILSIAAGSGIVVIGVLVILYAWQLWPFTSAIQSTENAYVRGQVTFISPQVNGYLTSVEVIDLQPVKKGQLLMTIDDRIYRQRVHQAQAQLAMKQAALNNNLQQRRSAEATIQSNKAALENAKAQALKSGFDLKRVENLTADGSLSVRERDAARAANAQAQAQVRQAAAQIAVAEQNLQTVIVNRDALEGDVDSARAALELAEIDLANTRITAPDDGQLGQLSVRTGAYVTAGTRLTSVVPNHKWIIANLKETQLANIRPGLPVTIRVDALDGKRFNGQVEFISPAAGSEFSAISPDNATGNFVKIAQRIPVRIRINDQDMHQLRPGMSVEVNIDTAAQPAAEGAP
ncbi:MULTISPECIES: HlyD family secretion protein [Pantoea]|jgi:multidrug resistance efflux pump|uniref:HlyD family secretion protein n=1 Tax=Pantoea TaxID=53335 RepID=UPI0001E59B7B|nr:MULTISPECIES: HlyD family secretion protein [Pantoea]ADO09026.1 Multidrug resistance protein K [Pantoea vagans C9-1]MBK5013778.1 HlyD family secretion protein [Pantoea sp. S62]MCJ7925501.1 HlyD family secretion protein [Pantoea vagans]PAW37003.1 HlyD family secretion protein [Pantoea vagans]QPG25922.1 HlyD family secretion protein [Pantoea sp. SM3640]